jgi:uncharacterized protein involved in exopolysaccharide biosynthesis
LAIVPVLAGLVAFSGSYVLSPTYESTTRLLIRGRDTTFLTSTGQGLDRQASVVDASLTKALGETQSALLSSRAVSEMVVDDLRLDQPVPKKRGAVARLRSAVSGGVQRVRAYLTHGFYAKPEPRTEAVDRVYEGLSARPLKDSYVIELRATADSGPLAKSIADAAADSLVEVSKRRFQQDSVAYRDFLAAQVARADQDQKVATDAVRMFKEQHRIGDVTLQIQLSETGAQQLRAQREQVQVDLDGARAEAAAIDRTLQSTPPTDSQTTKVQTGRSNTEIQSSVANTAYTQLLTSKQQLEARIAGLEARKGAIDRALAPGVSKALTNEEAELAHLELQRTVAADTYKDLSARYQEAVVSAERGTVELTRIDQAATPTYPVSPVRYLYLFLGFLFGGVAVLALKALRWRTVEIPESETDTVEISELALT